MRWFDQTEICQILSRFSTVAIGGDSMMRNLAIAMNFYLRKDMNTGPMQNWVVDTGTHDCHCDKIFTSPDCIDRGAWSSKEIWWRDPESMWCERGEIANVECEYLMGARKTNDLT